MKPIIQKSFYFIRHAQTDANAQGLTCGGDWDIPLNEKGIEQVKLARPSLESVRDQIRKIIVSPMIRTQKTAELLNQNLSLPVELNEGLREWMVGQWEGKPWDDVPNPFTTWENPPGGEMKDAFQARVVSTINSCLEKEDNLLFVSHGAFAHMLFSFMEIETPFIDNATLYRLTPQADRWQLSKVFEE